MPPPPASSGAQPENAWRDLHALLRRPGFRRLYATRLAGQFGDGVFQAALASSVLFNPDRQAEPIAVALGFAVLLLPYSVLGPFTGVLLDRFPRRNILLWANVIRGLVVIGVSALLLAGGRAWPFLLLALVSVAVNRFFLAGLSAGLPHVADERELVTANALSPTSGTVAYTLGVSAAVGLTTLLDAGDAGYALVTLVAVGFYLGSALLAAGFAVKALGPDGDQVTKAQVHMAPVNTESVGSVIRGMVAGVRHLTEQRAAGYALLTVGLYRLGFGVSTMALLLLYRNTFAGSGPFPAGETGLGQAVLVTGAGAFLAALVTPIAVARISRRAWMTVLVTVTAVVWPLLAAAPNTFAAISVSLLTGVAAQAVKIVVDTGVQTETDDAYRGRVFALYDMLFNVCLVAGLLLGAATLPESGHSWAVLGTLGLGYLLLAAWISVWTTRQGWNQVQRPTPVEVERL